MLLKPQTGLEPVFPCRSSWSACRGRTWWTIRGSDLPRLQLL